MNKNQLEDVRKRLEEMKKVGNLIGDPFGGRKDEIERFLKERDKVINHPAFKEAQKQLEAMSNSFGLPISEHHRSIIEDRYNELERLLHGGQFGHSQKAAEALKLFEDALRLPYEDIKQMLAQQPIHTFEIEPYSPPKVEAQTPQPINYAQLRINAIIAERDKKEQELKANEVLCLFVVVGSKNIYIIDLEAEDNIYIVATGFDGEKMREYNIPHNQLLYYFDVREMRENPDKPIH
jgi:hypothetical protein